MKILLFCCKLDIFSQEKQQITRFGEAVLEKSKQELLKEIDNILENVPPPPKLEVADKILSVLDDAENVLPNDYLSEKTLNTKNIEEIKNEYNFDDIKNQLDEGHVSPFLNIFYGGENESFCRNCDMLGLNENNSIFTDFISSEKGAEML